MSDPYRARTLPAGHLRPGMVIPKQILDGPHHVVQSIAPHEDGRGVHVVTNHGAWDFAWSDLATFPRRPDGSTRDWFREGVTPTVEDLAVGDILPPAEPHPTVDPIWEGMEVIPPQVIGNWAANVQTVTAVHRNRRDGELIRRVRTRRPVGPPLNHGFGIGQPIEFPHVTPVFPKIPDRHRSPAPFGSTFETRYHAEGPYVRPDGKVVMVAVHPHGRGRWPRPFQPDGVFEVNDDLTLVRPPGFSRNQWAGWQCCGTSHPNDRWSERGDTSDPRVSAVAQAFEDWHQSSEKYEGDYDAERLKRERMG